MNKVRIMCLLVIVAIFFGAFPSLTNAQVQNLPKVSVLPDSPFYFLVSIGEQLSVFLTPGGSGKAKQEMLLADTRLAESYALLMKRKPSDVLTVLEKYEEYVLHITERLRRETGRGLETDQMVSIISERFYPQQMTLADLYVISPEQIQPAVFLAMQTSKDAYKKAITYLSPDQQGNLMRNTAAAKEQTLQYISNLRIQGNDLPYFPLETEQDAF